MEAFNFQVRINKSDTMPRQGMFPEGSFIFHNGHGHKIISGHKMGGCKNKIDGMKPLLADA